MASQLAGEPSSSAPDGNFKASQEKAEEVGEQWYFSRKELEENSPSRRDGIDLKKETYLRKSYCTFLQDLGMRLKVPQDKAKEVSNQMLELYEQNRVSPSQASEAEGSAGDSQRLPSKALANEGHDTGYNSFHGGATSKMSLKPAPSRPGSDGHHNRSGPPGVNQVRNNEYGSSENNSISDHRGEDEIHDREVMPQQGNSGETQNKSKLGHGDEDHERDAVEPKDKYHVKNVSNKDDSAGQLPQDSTKKLDKEKIKAALFERRKVRGDIIRKIDPLDELERELEDVEVPGDSNKTKRERKQSWPKPSRPELENTQSTKYSNEAGDSDFPAMTRQSSHEDDFDSVEEGEVEPSDEVGREYRSPRSIRKRKPSSPLDRNGLGRHGYSERDHKRHVQENHV